MEIDIRMAIIKPHVNRRIAVFPSDQHIKSKLSGKEVPESTNKIFERTLIANCNF